MYLNAFSGYHKKRIMDFIYQNYIFMIFITLAYVLMNPEISWKQSHEIKVDIPYHIIWTEMKFSWTFSWIQTENSC